MELSLMNNYIVWNIDPVIANIGPLQLRYYGILFATAILIGFYLARRIYRKYGFPDKMADDLLIWGVVATVIGARLVHCLFYEPSYYLSNPLEILKVYKGGIASHGATVGLIVAVIFISRKYKLSFTDLADGVGAALIVYSPKRYLRISPYAFSATLFPSIRVVALSLSSKNRSA